MVEYFRLASEKATESERLRRGAVQEAAFFRAKVATLESNSPIDLARIEKERINELEKQLQALTTEYAGVRRDLENSLAESSTSRQSHAAAIERETDTLRRAEDAEEAHRLVVQEAEDSQKRATSSENSLREHTERLITLSSVVQQREAERDHLQSQLNDALAAREEHVGLIEQAQAAISAAGQRTTELDGMYTKSTARITELEEELTEIRTELEAKTRESELASGRLADLENAYTKSREEADTLRTVTTSRLGELLDSHKELRADESRATRGHQEQIRALEEEGKSLRRMLREAGQRVDAAEAGVSHHRQKARHLETQHHSLRAEIRSHQTTLLKAQSEVAKYKGLHSTKEAELQNRDVVISEAETRCIMLRNLLADHGIAISNSEPVKSEASGTRDLEVKLRERIRAHEESQREVEELTRRCHEAEDKVESLGRLVGRLKDSRSPTSLSMRSPTPPPESDWRATEAERKIAELEFQHREKMASLEGDYQTAVRYVKGTEKMLKRMKVSLGISRVI